MKLQTTTTTLPSAIEAVMELGYPRRLAQHHYRPGMRAGDLLVYLDMHVDNIDEEEKTLRRKEQQQERDKEAALHQNEQNEALRRETNRLLYQQTCAHCHRGKRAFVLFPCSHLALCTLCQPTQTVCPCCSQTIECAIRTFF